jgi:cytochrome c-type biogenesis protein CcmH
MADARRLFLAALLAFASAAFAVDAPAPAPSAASTPANTGATVKFQTPTATLTAADPALEARMLALTGELRCLVCQNQTIADSHADLAVDLRQEVREMLKRGMTDDQVRSYMTDRYGDFILYRPPFKATTAVLWLGPALLLAIALIALVVVIRRRSRLADDHFEADPVFEGDAPDVSPEITPDTLSRPGTLA